jgi:hypothetical protein
MKSGNININNGWPWQVKLIGSYSYRDRAVFVFEGGIYIYIYMHRDINTK